MEYYAIESYNPSDGKIRRLFVGGLEEARMLMRDNYAIAHSRGGMPFYRLREIDEADYQATVNGDVYELPDERGEYTITEAAGILDVSRQRVHAMLKAGILEGHRVGNQWSIYRSSVENRLESMR